MDLLSNQILDPLTISIRQKYNFIQIPAWPPELIYHRCCSVLVWFNEALTDCYFYILLFDFFLKKVYIICYITFVLFILSLLAGHILWQRKIPVQQLSNTFSAIFLPNEKKNNRIR